MNKVLTYDYANIIRACHSEQKDNQVKEDVIKEHIGLMDVNGRKFYKLEDSETGALLGYEIFDSNHNSVKKFDRK